MADQLWLLGVFMSIIASISSNFGVNVQKYSMMHEALRPRQRPYIMQPLWVVGLGLVILGSLGDFAALGFAAQSLITPVGGFTMVANVVFAHFWLQEKLSKKDLAGTFGIIVGVVLIAIFADKAGSEYTIDQLILLYQETSFIVYAIVVSAVALALYIAVKYIERIHKAGGAYSAKYRKLQSFHRFIYPTLSGVLGAQSVLFAKSTAELVKSAARGEPAFKDFVTYIIIICMFTTIFMQLHWLAIALKWFDAVYVIPVFQCFFITGSIFGGATYFKELEHFDVVQSIMFPFGVLVTLGGIVLLSQHRNSGAVPLRARLRRVAFAVLFLVRVQSLVHQRGEPRSLETTQPGHHRTKSLPRPERLSPPFAAVPVERTHRAESDASFAPDFRIDGLPFCSADHEEGAAGVNIRGSRRGEMLLVPPNGAVVAEGFSQLAAYLLPSLAADTDEGYQDIENENVREGSVNSSDSERGPAIEMVPQGASQEADNTASSSPDEAMDVPLRTAGAI